MLNQIRKTAPAAILVAIGEGNQLSGWTIPWLSEVLFVAAAILFAIWVWPHLPNLAWRARWLPLKDAAQLVFDETRKHWITQTEAGMLPENPLLPVARKIIAVAPMVYGKLHGATQYDEIPLIERQNMNVSPNMECIGKPSPIPKYHDVRLRRKDMKAALKIIHQENQIYE